MLNSLSMTQLDEEVTLGERAEYQIYVRTGNRIGASTKAEVKLTLYGERGRSKEIVLDKSKRHKVCFQKGKVRFAMKIEWVISPIRLMVNESNQTNE